MLVIPTRNAITTVNNPTVAQLQDPHSAPQLEQTNSVGNSSIGNSFFSLSTK